MKRASRFALAGVSVLALGGLLVSGHGADATMGVKTSSPAKRAALNEVKPPQPVATATPKVESSETVKEPSLRIDAAAGTDLFAAKSWYVPPPPPPPPPPPKPAAPPFPYVYGGAQRDGGSITLFLTLGERNVIVHPGETLDGAYRLDEIANGEAVFTYLPLNEQQRLPIGNLN